MTQFKLENVYSGQKSAFWCGLLLVESQNWWYLAFDGNKIKYYKFALKCQYLFGKQRCLIFYLILSELIDFASKPIKGKFD